MQTFSRMLRLASTALVLLLLTHCGSSQGAAPASVSCDAGCPDQIAVRALRTGMQIAFNNALYGQPVGAQDKTVSCFSGSAHIVGTATSNAMQGSTMVDLDWELSACSYLGVSATQTENYNLTFQGSLHEQGTLAVQPTSTASLDITSDDFSFDGSVFDPPLAYQQEHCALDLIQNGNALNGTICGRPVGTSF